MWFFFKKNNYFKNNILINKLLSAQVVKKAISTLLVIQILYNPLISRTCYNLHKPSEKSSLWNLQGSWTQPKATKTRDWHSTLPPKILKYTTSHPTPPKPTKWELYCSETFQRSCARCSIGRILKLNRLKPRE